MTLSRASDVVQQSPPPESVRVSVVVEREVALPLETDGSGGLQRLFLMLVEAKAERSPLEILDALAAIPDAVGKLLPLLRSTRADVPMAVLRVVRHMGERSAQPAMMVLSRHGSTSVRVALVTLLGDWSRDSVDPTDAASLSTFLFDPDPGVRGLASHYLLACGAMLPDEVWHAVMRQETQVAVAECLLRLRPQERVADAGHLRTIASMVSARRPVEVLQVLLDDLCAFDASRALQVAKHLRCHPRADYARLGESLLRGLRVDVQMPRGD
jgi:hypothetical protein